ncbi:MAG: TatD family hydrolase [Parachlamydia sp.]|jgi:TatD DNase family protein|nr:TatD family hydrolase [Parachlamydia sp.]
MMHYFDSHAHLTGDALYPSIDECLSRSWEAGVRSIMNICTDLKTLERGLELTARTPWVYQAAATTPHDVEKEGELVFERMAAPARQGLLKAVGETGLDYYYEHSAKDIQKKFLVRYLQLALECKLPVIIHCREAFNDLFEILDSEYRVQGTHAPGILHCFTGSIQEAEEVIKRGWMLSLSGITTFKKSHALHQVALEVPLDQLLIETDAPYLAPQGKRGKTNEPAFVVETAAFIARTKNVPLEVVVNATYQNAKNIFNI